MNLAEVYAKIIERDHDLDAVAGRLLGLGLASHPFTGGDACLTANLYPLVRRGSLSLGDRACLALGLRLALPGLTADRAWVHLDLDLSIRLIR